VIRLLTLFVLAGVISLAQVPSGKTLAVYIAARESSGTTEKLTIQQPASGSKRVRFISAYVYCSAGCTVTQSRNGTAATSTSLTVGKINPESTPNGPTATAWHTSNVGSGTSIGGNLTLDSTNAYQAILDLDGIYMMDDGTAINYTIAVSATSGTNRIVIKWEEY
jgi:hypothetical protein